MRLMLHGRSSPSILLRQIEQARMRPEGSITTLLLSGWKFDDDHGNFGDDNIQHQRVFNELCMYIMEHSLDEIILHNCHQAPSSSSSPSSPSLSPHQQQRDDDDDCDEDDSSSCSLLPRRNQNDNSNTDQLRLLVSTIVQAPASCKALTIRYSTQQDCIPQEIVNGLLDACCWSSLHSALSSLYYHDGDRDDHSITATTGSASVASTSTSTTSLLEELNFRGMTLTLENIQSLNIILKELSPRSLSFKCNYLWTDLEAHYNSRKKRGEHLSLLLGAINNKKRPMMTRQFIQAIQYCTPTLECLELEDCFLTDEDMAMLFYVLRNTATTMNASFDDEDEEDDSIGTSIVSPLKTLKLRGNCCQRQSMESLKHWLADPNCSLEVLDLSWQQGFVATDQHDLHHHHHHDHQGDIPSYRNPLRGCQYLTEGLAYNSSLRTLILSENRLKSDYMTGLSRALMRNKTLKDLIMKDCDISTHGICLFGQGLHKFQSLQTLDLNGNQRVPSGRAVMEILFKPLSRNAFLHSIILPHGDCAPSGSPWSYLLEWNRAGRQVLLDPQFPATLWPLVLARADEICRREHYHHCNDDKNNNNTKRRATKHGASAIYYLLREKGHSIFGELQ